MCESERKERYFNNIVQAIGVFIIGLTMGRCRFFSSNAIGIGFFGAACLSGKYMWLAYVGTLLGMFTTCTIHDTVKYSILMFLIVALMKFENLNIIKNRDRVFPVLFGIVVIITEITGYILISSPDSIINILINGLIVFSASYIFNYALWVLKEDYMKICVENEALISVTLFLSAVMYGMPDKLFDIIVVRESVALFLIIYFVYRFGIGIGITYCVINGLILGYESKINYITPWVITTVLAFGISLLFGKNKYVFVICFALIYLLVGYFSYENLISIDSIKALISSGFVFMLLPSCLTYKLDENIRKKREGSDSAEWGRWILTRIDNLAETFKRLDLSFAGAGNLGIGLSDIGDVIDGFAGKTAKTVQPQKTVEGDVVEALTKYNIFVKDFFVKKYGDGKNEVYITLKSAGRKICTTESVRKILSEKMGLQLISMPENRTVIGQHDEIYGFREKPIFKCVSAVRMLSCDEMTVSGDNYYIGEAIEGKQVLMLADGMGNGINASSDSNELLELIEELLSAGFDQQLTIRAVNSYISEKNKGEMFSTLDMVIVDLYSGYSRVYKCGSCMTLIVRKDWVEAIKSTSLPIGVTGDYDFESGVKKLYDRDVIIMISDGILENIDLEDKEKYIIEFINNSNFKEPEEIVSLIAGHIRQLNGKRLKDDATIIATKIVRC